MTDFEVSSVASFLDALPSLFHRWYPSTATPSAIWYRGQPDNSHDLLPTLYRPELLDRNYDEVTLLEQFKAQAPPSVPREPTTEWEWHFLARHHGLPSRLLDWTENALAALWFAIIEHVPQDKAQYHRIIDQPRPSPIFDSTSPVVWAIDPGVLNASSFGPDDDKIFMVGGDFSKHWLADFVSKGYPTGFSFDGADFTNELPMAVFPTRRNTRIVAQQGVFTVHGFSRVPINELRPFSLPNSPYLQKIIIDPAAVCHIHFELDLLGITRHSLYPDLDNLSYYLQWAYWLPETIEGAG